MKISFLYKFLIAEIDINTFKNQIIEEVEVYKLNLQKKGSSVILPIEEDLQFVFKKEHLLKLCDHFLNEELTFWELEYIADCITLSECAGYENEELVEFLESMTDSKVNGEITKERVTRLKNAITDL